MTGMAAVKPQVLVEVPVSDRERILSGMRWTVWLSALAAPFSYLTPTLLARMGPSVIGTWGVLTLFLTFCSSFLYLGGDSVIVRFAPLIPAKKRFSFLSSYFLIVFGGLLLCAVALTAFPQLVRFLLGEQANGSLWGFAVWMAPLWVVRSMVLAGLTSALDIRGTQVLNRIGSIGTSLIYCVLCQFFQPFFRLHFRTGIWLIYICFSTLTLAAGLRRLAADAEWRTGLGSIAFFLPAGFWKYLSSLQQASLLSFFGARLDMMLVLHFGGLETLGRYVTAFSIASMLGLVNRTICEPLLPALTRLQSPRDRGAASAVFTMNLRLLYALNAAMICGGLAMMGVVLRFLGPLYAADRTLFIVMLLSYGFAGPGYAGGTLLTSTGRQQLSVWVTLAQVALIALMFPALWPIFGLTGAAAASGVAMLAGNIGLLALARRHTRIVFRYGRDYFCLILVGIATTMLSVGLQVLGPVASSLVCCAGLGAFWTIAGYSPAELGRLLAVFLPSKTVDRKPIAAECP